MQIGSSNEIYKYILKKNYLKNNEIVVDDLFILNLEKCKKSILKFCIFCEELIVSEEARKILNYYSAKCPTYQVSLKLFERIASKENCAGILLCCKLSEPTINKNTSFILVCDGLEISGNIGTIFRTCEAVKIDLVIFTNIKAKINDDKVVRSSRGMIFNVPFIIMDNVNDVNEYLDKLNARKIICEPENGINFKKFNYDKTVALIVGSERFGVDKFWFNQNCEKLKISMYGEMDSLNVGVATSIILYEAKEYREDKE